MTQQIPYLDGWRGLAIACLLLGHFFPVPGINLGTVGVALFFVLSGLLMARLLFVQQVALGTFFRRRISRVFPSVAVYLLAVCAMFAVTGKSIALGELLPAMTFTNNYFQTRNWTMPLGHIWSLSVEEHSYVILSIVAYCCRSWGRTRALSALAAVLAVTVMATAFYSFLPDTPAPGFRLRTEVASFGIFASGFVMLAMWSKKLRLSMPWIAPGGLVLGLLAHWWSVPSGLTIIAGWGAFALAINAMPGAPRAFLALFELRCLRRLGMYSFSLYLWQQPWYQMVSHAGLTPWLGLLLAAITGVAAYYLVEKPARRYLNQRWAPLPGSTISTEPTMDGVASAPTSKGICN